MRFYINVLVVTLVFAVLATAQIKLCDPFNTTFLHQKAKLRTLEDGNSKVPRTVYGDVQVMDGCRFRVSNLTIIPPGQGVYWYAIPSKTPTDEEPALLSRVVLQALGAYNGQRVDFTLAPGYVFEDFAVVLLYSEGDRKSYAAFGVTGKVKDYLQLPDDTANLQIDPDTFSSARQVTAKWAYILFLLCLVSLV